MAKINFKSKIEAALINKKNDLKINGEKIRGIDLELLEIPAIAVNSENNLDSLPKKKMNKNRNEIDELVKEVPAPNFKRHKKHYAVDATADSIVDMPFTETYQDDFNETRRVANILKLDTGENERQIKE